MKSVPGAATTRSVVNLPLSSIGEFACAMMNCSSRRRQVINVIGNAPVFDLAIRRFEEAEIVDARERRQPTR